MVQALKALRRGQRQTNPKRAGAEFEQFAAKQHAVLDDLDGNSGADETRLPTIGHLPAFFGQFENKTLGIHPQGLRFDFQGMTTVMNIQGGKPIVLQERGCVLGF